MTVLRRAIVQISPRAFVAAIALIPLVLAACGPGGKSY